MCVCGGEGVLNPFHAIICEKFTVTRTFKRQEFERESFKPHLTLPFCKIRASRMNSGLNRASHKTLCHPRKCPLKFSIFCFCFVLSIGPKGAIVRRITLR